MLKTFLWLALFATVVAPPACPKKGGSGPAGVVGGGVSEPDYKYPWVVHIQDTACHGTLIHPKWVLTAAHCVENRAKGADFSRTDPYTGMFYKGSSNSAGAPQMLGIAIHPLYKRSEVPLHDIALIRLADPFAISPYIQTAALPTVQRKEGMVGTVASGSHTRTLPPDKVAIFRSPIVPSVSERVFSITSSPATGSLCPGDSGSGFVTYENGRAVVRGVTSTTREMPNCDTVTGDQVDFVDVFAYRDWILETIRMTDTFLAGNTRLRRVGSAARGMMGIGCDNPYGTMWGPLNVVGVEVGANCGFDDKQTIVCSISAGQTGPKAPRITGFTMKTFLPDGTRTEESLPFKPGWASYFGNLPHGFHREFTCKIGLGDAINTDDVFPGKISKLKIEKKPSAERRQVVAQEEKSVQ